MTLSRCDQRVTNALVTRTSHHPVPTRPDPSRNTWLSLHGIAYSAKGRACVDAMQVSR